MASARKLPSGNWRVNLFVGTENGKRKYKSFTHQDKKQAELLAAQYNVDRKEKIRCVMTVKEAITQYIDSKSNVFSPTTIRNYRGYLRTAFNDILSVRVCDLTPVKIQRWINAISANHSPKTVKNVYYLFVPAIQEVDKQMDVSAKLPAPVKYESTIPVQKDIEALIRYFEQRPDYHTAIMICAILGLRRGEACALTFGDVLPNGRLRVNKSMALNDQKKWVIKYPKTKESTRDLVLPDFLKDRILALKTEKSTDSDRIFAFNPNQLTDNFCHARKKIGFNFRLHDLRHYYASILLSLNTPDKYAMARMGHSTSATLKRVYQHLMDEKEKEVDDNLSEYMSRYSDL